jgi:polysaccharide export outer membrane protein
LRKFAFFALLAMLVSPALVSPAAAQVSEEDGLYRIRAGDTLQVSVLEDPNLGRQVLVRPDGYISLPIAGTVKAAGLTPERLETVLQQKFSRGFEITPTVTVSLRFLAPGGEAAALNEEAVTFYMLGSVGRRGPITVPEPVTILEALAIVGGPNQFAANHRIQIRRMVDDVEQIILFDYDRVIEGKPVEGNIEIEDGDIIVVPERTLFN